MGDTVELFTDTTIAGAKIGCDFRAAPNGSYCGFFGASYALPSSIPVLTNAHVGTVVSLHDKRPSLGLFGELPVPSLKKTVVGLELFDSPRAALFGAELVLDGENSVLVKAGDNGVAQCSWVKKFSGIELRCGVEANLKQP